MKTKAKKKKLSENMAFVGYTFVFPWLFGFIFLTIIPMIVSLYLSFTDYSLTAPPEWIGLDNYIRMFTEDDRYYTSIGVTFYFVFVSVPLKLIFALLVAFLLNHKMRIYNTMTKRKRRQKIIFLTAVSIFKNCKAMRFGTILYSFTNSILISPLLLDTFSVFSPLSLLSGKLLSPFLISV